MSILYYFLYFGTILLLLVGAQLQVLKTALVCPDWPLCYGEFFPMLMGPAVYESLHRFLAMIIGFGTFIWSVLRYKELKIKSFLPLSLILLQSLLGLATFIYKLPTITTVLHLIFSLLFLSSLEGTRKISFDEKLKSEWNPNLKDVVGSFLFLLIVQFLLGGILRKSSLLASCESTMDFWSCWRLQSEIPFAGSLALLHRILGVATTITGLFVFSYLSQKLPKWRIASGVGILLMISQMLLGLQMGKSSGREMIFWHFTMALFSFCLLLFLVIRLRRYEVYFFGKPIPTKMNDILDLFKPKLTILVVVTLLVGVFLAPMQMNVISLFISLISIWLQAAGSLALNSYIEREEDKLMERTMNRPLPSGRLSPRVALIWGWSLVFIGTIILMITANFLTAFLGLFSVLSYLYIYTPLKLKTPYALYVGAIPGAIPTLMGWTTVTGSIGGFGVYLFGILFVWQIPHFMAISLYRKNEYARAKFMTFAQTHSLSFLKTNILLYSFFLMLFGMIPFLAGWRGGLYLWISLALSVILFLIALSGLFLKWEEKVNKWARVYFFATIFYLPLILGILLVLR